MPAGPRQPAREALENIVARRVRQHGQRLRRGSVLPPWPHPVDRGPCESAEPTRRGAGAASRTWAVSKIAGTVRGAGTTAPTMLRRDSSLEPPSKVESFDPIEAPSWTALEGSGGSAAHIEESQSDEARIRPHPRCARAPGGWDGRLHWSPGPRACIDDGVGTSGRDQAGRPDRPVRSTTRRIGLATCRACERYGRPAFEYLGPQVEWAFPARSRRSTIFACHPWPPAALTNAKTFAADRSLPARLIRPANPSETVARGISSASCPSICTRYCLAKNSPEQLGSRRLVHRTGGCFGKKAISGCLLPSLAVAIEGAVRTRRKRPGPGSENTVSV